MRWMLPHSGHFFIKVIFRFSRFNSKIYKAFAFIKLFFFIVSFSGKNFLKRLFKLFY